MEQGARFEPTVYLPEFCDQGGNVPFYVLWDASHAIEVGIKFPKGLELIELYNVSENAVAVENTKVIIHQFEVPGYVGGLFASRVDKDPSLDLTVTIEISEANQQKLEYKKNVHLFRPDVGIESSPERVVVEVKKNKKVVLDRKIVLANKGEGTGILRFQLSAGSQLRIEHPVAYRKFVQSFIRDLRGNLKPVAAKYPRYSELVQPLLDFSKNPFPTKKESRKAAKRFLEKLQSAFEDNEKFMEEYSLAVVNAVVRNMPLFLDVGAFLVYVRTILARNMLLLNATQVIRVKRGSSTIRPNLVITDLRYQPYRNIRLPPMIVESNEDCEIPLYQLIATERP